MTIRINRVYTKAGDGGETRLVGGQKVPKDALRIESYGTVDELSSILGLCRQAAAESKAPPAEKARFDRIFLRVQNELFNLGSDLATLDEDRHHQQPIVEERHIEALERDLDEMNDQLPELRSFVLPGGGWLSSYLHLARTVCRRAERLTVALAREEKLRPECVRYLNRLSDALFVMGRWAAHVTDEPEPLWEPEKT